MRAEGGSEGDGVGESEPSIQMPSANSTGRRGRDEGEVEKTGAEECEGKEDASEEEAQIERVMPDADSDADQRLSILIMIK